MDIHFQTYEGGISLHYESKYAAGSIPIIDIRSLIRAIEEVCGKGSCCLYTNKDNDYPDAIEYRLYKKYKGKWPQITYWQQGVKTDVIEQARKAARKVWGDIPELKIGWLENQLRSYVEDIQE